MGGGNVWCVLMMSSTLNFSFNSPDILTASHPTYMYHTHTHTHTHTYTFSASNPYYLPLTLTSIISLTNNWRGYLHIFCTGVSRNPSKDMSCRFRSNLQLCREGGNGKRINTEEEYTVNRIHREEPLILPVSYK